MKNQSAPQAQPDPGPLPPPRLRRPDREQMLLRPSRSTNSSATTTTPASSGNWSRPGTSPLPRHDQAPGARRRDGPPPTRRCSWPCGSTPPPGASPPAGNWHRLCEESDPYRWLCGGVSVNYHMLNDFRVDHEAVIDDLLTQMLAVLIHGDAVRSTGSPRTAPGSAPVPGPTASRRGRPSSRPCNRPGPPGDHPAAGRARRRGHRRRAAAATAGRPREVSHGWSRPWRNWPRSSRPRPHRRTSRPRRTRLGPDDRPGGAVHADARRRQPPGVQRATGGGYREPADRRAST